MAAGGTDDHIDRDRQVCIGGPGAPARLVDGTLRPAERFVQGVQTGGEGAPSRAGVRGHRTVVPAVRRGAVGRAVVVRYRDEEAHGPRGLTCRPASAATPGAGWPG